MGAIRMNITLPEKTVKRLRRAAKPRERSAIIAKALDMYFRRQAEFDLVKDLIEDYRSTQELSQEDRDWVGADFGDSTREG